MQAELPELPIDRSFADPQRLGHGATVSTVPAKQYRKRSGTPCRAPWWDGWRYLTRRHGRLRVGRGASGYAGWLGIGQGGRDLRRRDTSVAGVHRGDPEDVAQLADIPGKRIVGEYVQGGVVKVIVAP